MGGPLPAQLLPSSAALEGEARGDHTVAVCVAAAAALLPDPAVASMWPLDWSRMRSASDSPSPAGAGALCIAMAARRRASLEGLREAENWSTIPDS